MWTKSWGKRGRGDKKLGNRLVTLLQWSSHFYSHVIVNSSINYPAWFMHNVCLSCTRVGTYCTLHFNSSRSFGSLLLTEIIQKAGKFMCSSCLPLHTVLSIQCSPRTGGRSAVIVSGFCREVLHESPFSTAAEGFYDTLVEYLGTKYVCLCGVKTSPSLGHMEVHDERLYP